MSVRQSLGKVAVVPKGSWDGTKTYEFLDIVKSGGGSYIARQDVPIGIAITNTEYWVSLVDKGDPGDSAIVPAYIDTDVIRYLNDHGTHAADDIYTSLLMREDVDSGVLPFIMRPTGSDSTTEEYFELDHQIHSADSPVIHFRSREHLLAVDSTGHFTMTDRPQIDSVNGKTGAVVLDASDVGALPADTPIPAAVTEQTVAGWGFTKNTGTYSKPSGGIPKSDLASDVQTSLGKADSALQQHQSLAGYATETYVQQQIAAIDTGGSGFTAQFVTAFSNFLDHLSGVFDDPNGQTYIDALKNALQGGESSDGITFLNGVLRISETASVTATQSGSILTLA